MAGNVQRRLLLVEPGGLEHVRNALSSGGFEVVTVGDAEAALQLLQGSEPFDLLLCDAKMPGTDGFETCRRARAMAGRGNLGVVRPHRHRQGAPRHERH